MSFELQPTLEGELVRLRPMRPDDFSALYAVARDPLIWEQHPENTRWQEGVFRKYCDGAMASGGGLIAHDRRSGAVIGASRYYFLDEAAGVVEIGYTFLARDYWGGAWNGEMKRLMIAHAFRFVPVVALRVGITNWRSQGAMRKIGGVISGHDVGSLGEPCYVYRFLRP